MRILFNSFCPPYVKGDVAGLDRVVAEKFVAAGAASYVDQPVEKPAEEPVEKKAPARKRGRPKKVVAEAEAGE